MFKKVIKDRLDIVKYLMILLFVILIFRLADLQIAQGDEFKRIADILRFRTVNIQAPRGTVVDKYGRLIAGNRQSYSVNIMKTEASSKTINDTALAVVNIILQNGDTYKDDIPILINPIRFKFEDDELNWKSKHQIPQEYTAKKAFMKLRTDYSIYQGISDEEAFDILKKNYGVDLPFSVPQFQFSFDREEIKWKKNLGFDQDETAEDIFYRLLEKYRISTEVYNDEKARKILPIKYLLGQNRYKAYEPVEIAVNINEQTRAEIEENKIYFPGVEILEKPLRTYPYKQLGSHIIGYMGKIGSGLEELMEKGYTPLDMIGKTGIEYSMEKYLKGTDGSKLIEVDVSGTLINTIDKVDPIPGDTVFLTIDTKLQKVAEDALRNTIKTINEGDKSQRIDSFVNAKTGAVVAMDVNTGKVLAMASESGFDPNLFAAGINSRDWKSLQSTQKGRFVPRPLVNNAISAVLPPGSTLKMLVGIAGLNSDAITTTEKINDVGPYTYFVSNFRYAPSCSYYKAYRIGHGLTDLFKAVKVSCNYFFFEVGRRIGIETFEKYAKDFGFGELTGIELPAEERGSIEGPTHQKRLYRSYLNSYIKNTLKIDDNDIKNQILSFIDDEIKSSDVSRKLQELGVTEDYTLIQDNLKKLGYNKKYTTIAYKVRELVSSQRTLGKVCNMLGINSSVKNGESIKAEIASVIRNVKIEDRIKDYLQLSKWKSGQITNAAIGQGATDVTPLQLTNYIATLVNGGKHYKPYIVDKVISYDGNEIIKKSPEIENYIDIKPQYLDVIKKGMYAVVNESGGTARRRFIGSTAEVSGKTGTAQVGGNYDAHAWFVGFAPYEKPEIAVVAVVTQGGHGDYVAPIVREVIEAYLTVEDSKDKISSENDIIE